MPTSPSSQQIANSLSPTPFTRNLPGDGMYRTGGDTVVIKQGNNVYQTGLQGLGQLSNPNDAKVGQSGSYAQNLGRQYLTGQGVNYDNLSQLSDAQWADLNAATSNGEQGLKYGATDLGTLSGLWKTPTTAGSSEILNTTPNQLGAPTGVQPATVGNQTNALQGALIPQQTDAQRAASFAAAGLSPQQQSNVSSGQQSALQGNTVGTSSSTSTPTLPQSNPVTGASDQYLQNYLKTLTPSDEENTVQKQLATLQQSQYLSHQGLEGQAIATPFITGQEAAVDKGLNQQQQTLTSQLAAAQKQRQSAMDVSKAALDYQISPYQQAQLDATKANNTNSQVNNEQQLLLNAQKQLADMQKPTEVSPGATLVNPQTNQPVYTAPTAKSQNPTLTAAETQQKSFSTINQLLGTKNSQGMPYTDTSGYLTAQGFKDLISAATSDGIKRADFLKNYGYLLSPNYLQGYNLTPADKKLLGY